jgi:DUF1680 family protein
MMRDFIATFIWAIVGVLGCISAARADLLTDHQPALQVRPVAPPVARAFSLHEVRLLAGEFKIGQDLATNYLLSLEPDRLLAGFRSEAGLPAKAKPYGGWEARSIAGHSLGHYLSACSLAWASTGDPEFQRRVNHIVDELAACQKAGGDGYLAAFKEGRKAFAEIATGHIRSTGFDLNGLWVPNYTIHKVLAGLRDAYRLAGNAQALAVERHFADWLDKLHSGLSEAQMQSILACEHGGMNEVFADLYADTGDARYLKLSQRFDHRAILDPLALGNDILPGKHANTQIPKIIGLATRHELTGARHDRLAAQFFWDRVVQHHSYVTGGHCDAEHFGPPDQLNDRLSAKTTETCNVNNMLKLTEHVFGWNPNAGAADFYERALLNQIRSSQHPDGRVIYNLSLKPGGNKRYESKYESFTCCVGTGMENHVKYGQGIYFHDASSLWVNLFIASELNWKARGITLRQETKWPAGNRSKIIISSQQPQEFSLRLRHPFWADRLTVKVNGTQVSDTTSPSSYCVIKRVWRDGDEIELQFPMSLRTEAMPDNPNRIAIFYGPTVLAADLGPVNDPAADKAGFVPALLADGRPVADWVKPVSLEKRTFKTVGVGKPREVELVPFHQLHDRRYTVYCDLFTAADWSKREAEIRADEQRQRALEARTTDVFQPGEMQPERDHNVQGEKSEAHEAHGRKLRHARDGGWFSYEMKVDPAALHELVCVWWGNETGERTFDILVDGTKIATQQLLKNQPGKFWDAVYPIPGELTRGKEKVTIKLQAKPGNYAGGLFGSRILRAESQPK